MLTHVKTSSGFETDIDEDVLDNMELLEVVYEISDTNLRPFAQIADMMLGKEGKKKLYDHVRVNGRVPINAVSEELTEIMNSLSKAKK